MQRMSGGETAMMQLFSSALAFPTVIFTVLLGFVVLFWLSVIVAGIDLQILDGAGHGDLGLDIHGDVGGDIHGDIHGDAGDMDADGHLGGHHGFASEILSFLNLGQVPLSIIGSVAILFAWIGSLTLQVTAGPWAATFIPATFAAVLCFGVAGLASLVLTGLATRPMRGVFKIVSQHAEETIVDHVCTIVTSRVDAEFGQASYDTSGAPLNLSVRCHQPNKLVKGSRAVIIGYDADSNTYEVGLLEPGEDALSEQQKRELKKKAPRINAALKRART
jgi:hypothetical protein